MFLGDLFQMKPIAICSLFTTKENETMSRTVSSRQTTEEKMSIAQIPAERVKLTMERVLLHYLAQIYHNFTLLFYKYSA